MAGLFAATQISTATFVRVGFLRNPSEFGADPFNVPMPGIENPVQISYA
jgi:hypothetical protein